MATLLPFKSSIRYNHQSKIESNLSLNQTYPSLRTLQLETVNTSIYVLQLLAMAMSISSRSQKYSTFLIKKSSSNSTYVHQKRDPCFFSRYLLAFTHSKQCRNYIQTYTQNSHYYHPNYINPNKNIKLINYRD